jgi:hypothetical protein
MADSSRSASHVKAVQEFLDRARRVIDRAADTARRCAAFMRDANRNKAPNAGEHPEQT